MVVMSLLKRSIFPFLSKNLRNIRRLTSADRCGLTSRMSTTVEHIKQEIRALAPTEVDELLRDLQQEYAMPEDSSIEAEWDAEIARRVKDVEEGKVELISGGELRRSTESLLRELGIARSK